MPTWPGAPISTRRMLTVTISAPLAAIASRITSKSRYLPVPTMRRELNARPPMMSGSPPLEFASVRVSCISTPLHHGDDFDDVAFGDRRVGHLTGAVDRVAVHHDDFARVDL